MARKQGENTLRITLYLDKEVAKKLKIEAIKKGESPSNLVESLLREKLRR